MTLKIKDKPRGVDRDYYVELVYNADDCIDVMVDGFSILTITPYGVRRKTGLPLVTYVGVSVDSIGRVQLLN